MRCGVHLCAVHLHRQQLAWHHRRSVFLRRVNEIDILHCAQTQEPPARPSNGKNLQVDLYEALGIGEDVWHEAFRYNSDSEGNKRSGRVLRWRRRVEGSRSTELENCCNGTGRQPRNVKSKDVEHEVLKVPQPASEHRLQDRPWRDAMSRGDHQDQRNAASCIKVDGGHQKQQKKHADAKQDEEQEHAVGIIAKSESLAHINRRVTRFYDEDAHISEDKSELNRDHECAVHVPLKWLDAHLQCKEGCADKQCHQDARLIGFLSDQQHEADEGQLATHLKRLPQ
mmetsp:Transcript_15136/g.40672  ORF Transcript_15136/g.40672 Transcript_15136/m.40672 type:complete len:283 (-) Transcript_15136:3219-4067(-)